ncbi:MAG: hypothetical protein NC231_00900, partial [Bacillus sp. (in: Bacteria)]|nr:hypothetical protein [Bacillus sp. (in: firmicutes)]
WAKLFKATTWEEIKMLAAKDPYINEASKTIFQLSAEEQILKRCRDREEYCLDIRAYEREIAESKKMLEEDRKVIEEKDEKLAEDKKMLEEKDKKLAEDEKMLAENEKTIKELRDEIEMLKANTGK